MCIYFYDSDTQQKRTNTPPVLKNGKKTQTEQTKHEIKRVLHGCLEKRSGSPQHVTLNSAGGARVQHRCTPGLKHGLEEVLLDGKVLQCRGFVCLVYTIIRIKIVSS